MCFSLGRFSASGDILSTRAFLFLVGTLDAARDKKSGPRAAFAEVRHIRVHAVRKLRVQVYVVRCSVSDNPELKVSDVETVVDPKTKLKIHSIAIATLYNISYLIKFICIS